MIYTLNLRFYPVKRYTTTAVNYCAHLENLVSGFQPAVGQSRATDDVTDKTAPHGVRAARESEAQAPGPFSQLDLHDLARKEAAMSD